MDTIVKAVAAVKALAGDTENGEFEVVLSTPTKDRDGDEVLTTEWELPLPEHITFDVDHGMSVLTTVGSGAPELDDDGRLIVRGTFASTQLAQQTRTLVNEKHIRTTSVAFLEKKTRVDGRTVTRRELLNGAFVAIPANPEALIVSSKSAAAAVEAETEQARVKAMTKAIAGSYEERQQAIYRAIDDLYDDWRQWAYLVGTTDDVAVWHVYSEDDDVRGDWRASYTIDEAFNVTLGVPEKVRVVEVVTELPADTAGTESSKSLNAPDSTADAAAQAAASAEEPGADDDAAALDGQDEEAVAKAAALATALSLDVQFL